MPDDTQRLGRCPDCNERIKTAWILVEYEKDDGTEGIWAECPSCEDFCAGVSSVRMKFFQTAMIGDTRQMITQSILNTQSGIPTTNELKQSIKLQLYEK